MNNILQIVKEFEGIIGAVLGSVATLIATDYLSKKGKLKIYLMKYEGKYYTNDKGEVRPIESENENIEYFSFSYKIQAYNRSDTPKIMRDFKVVFIKNNKIVHSFIPNDESTRKYMTHTYKVNEMEVSNVMPREIQVLEQSGYIYDEYLEIIEDSTKIELTYYDEKDKKRRIVLFKGVVNPARIYQDYYFEKEKKRVELLQKRADRYSNRNE